MHVSSHTSRVRARVPPPLCVYVCGVCMFFLYFRSFLWVLRFSLHVYTDWCHIPRLQRIRSSVFQPGVLIPDRYPHGSTYTPVLYLPPYCYIYSFTYFHSLLADFYFCGAIFCGFLTFVRLYFYGIIFVDFYPCVLYFWNYCHLCLWTH